MGVGGLVGTAVGGRGGKQRGGKSGLPKGEIGSRKGLEGMGFSVGATVGSIAKLGGLTVLGTWVASFGRRPFFSGRCSGKWETEERVWLGRMEDCSGIVIE